MSQIAGTRNYRQDSHRLSELTAKAKNGGLSLREAGELDFQRNAPKGAYKPAEAA